MEGKHRVFAWLLVQNKLLTADKLLARNWPCNPICPLCDQVEETAAHICLHCVFAQKVWLLIHTGTAGLVPLPPPDASLEIWWNDLVRAATKEDRRKLATLMIYTAWNLWKEWNRRVFDQVAMQPMAVLSLIKEEIKLRIVACGQELLPNGGL